MEVLDAQVHVHDPDHPVRVALDGPYVFPDVTEQLTAMNAAGVAGGLLTATLSTADTEGWSNQYYLSAGASASDRLRVIGRINPDSATLADDVAAWRQEPLAVGLRVTATNLRDRTRLANGAFDNLLASAERHGLPVCLYAFGALDAVAAKARQFPKLNIVLDHLGVAQSPFTSLRSEPLQDVRKVLRLAHLPRIFVKISGAISLSSEAPPYSDVAIRVREVIEVFGAQRCLWGSDWTRFGARYAYRDHVEFLLQHCGLREADLEDVAGRTLRRVFEWE